MDEQRDGEERERVQPERREREDRRGPGKEGNEENAQDQVLGLSTRSV
jgi:hypothetical protein